MSGRTRPPLGPIALALALLLVVVLPLLVRLYTDWLWFGEVGYQSVFARTLVAQVTLSAILFVVASLVLALNLRLALAALKRRSFEILTPEGLRKIDLDPGRLRPLSLFLALAGGLLAASFGWSQWDEWLFFANATPFGVADPILGWDIGFYLFRLPFLEFLYRFALALLGLSFLFVAAAHGFAGNLGLQPVSGGFFVHRTAVRHLSVLAAAIFLVLAFGAWLEVPRLLTSSSRILQGASYVDVHARLPALRVLTMVAAAGAVLAFVQAFRAGFRALGWAFGLYVIVWIGGLAYAAAVQRFVVAPNEQVRETSFIAHNIAATRAAFGLDQVEERSITGEARLTREAIDENRATFVNVPLWNHQPLLDTFAQLQEIRTYYDFVSVDNDRYWIDGEYRQIMLSARELSSESLPSRTWINERLTFTHGYGITLGPVNQVTREGLPVLFIRDLPPVSTVGLEVREPALYFGELSTDHVFVSTATEEFDYPRGDDNVFTTYGGTGGVPVGGFLRRLLFAFRFGSMDTLLSPALTPESRVLLYRRIADRVERIAPFFTFDRDPYLAIDEGRLVWIQDAYTTSVRYPYSSPVGGGTNYIRNSVKATIDAYHGTTAFYVIDPHDPVAATIGRIFPDLLKPLDEMPEGLRKRLRYPQDIFQIQASVFSLFHMTNPAVFYNREDQWEVPSIDQAGQPTRMDPYYTIMKLPGEEEVEYIQMLPYTPRQKDNLAAWMVARSDGEKYGKLVVFEFPKQTVVYGPRQVAARINQDQVISPQITLWNQQGSEVIQGDLLVIPIGESLVYVRPLYLRASGGRIPELKRVIVAYQNQIVMEETLEAALDRIFPAEGGPRPTAPPPTLSTELGPPEGRETEAADDLAARALEHYRRAIEAQRSGDWARYGEEIARLGELLERMGATRP